MNTPNVTIWYEAEMYGDTPKITPVRVIRETKHTITLADVHPGNARRYKSGTYFPTWGDARDYMLNCFMDDYRTHERALQIASANVSTVRALQKDKQS